MNYKILKIKTFGTCSDGTAGRVDVHMDGFRRVFRFKEKELRDYDVRGIVGNRAIDANDTFLQEAREYVVSSLSSGRVLNHHRYQTVTSPIRIRLAAGDSIYTPELTHTSPN